MAFDYSLRFTGQDDLSGVLGKVKKEIKDMGKEASNVELVDKAMEKIITSSGKLNTKVRQTSALLAEMKFDGDHNAAQFLSMAKAAGEAKDAIGDTQAMIKFFADDRRWLNTTVQGFQALAGVGSIAAGAMSLFGVESENATRAIQGCQTALAILNGIQTVANLLDKEGYLMTARKVIGLNAEAAAIDRATAAQLKNNMAVKSNPYVAAAAIVAALATGIAAWVSSMDEATDEQLALNSAVEAFNEAGKSQIDSLAKQLVAFGDLKRIYDESGGKADILTSKILENKEAQDEAGISCNTLNDVHKIFNGNTNAFVQASIKRRVAMMYETSQTVLLGQAMEKMAEIYKKIASGEEVNYSEFEAVFKMLGAKQDQINKAANRIGVSSRTDQSIVGAFGHDDLYVPEWVQDRFLVDAYTELYNVFEENIGKQLQDAAKGLNNDAKAQEANFQDILKRNKQAYLNARKGGSSGTTKIPPKDQKGIKAAKDSLQDINDQITKVTNELVNGVYEKGSQAEQEAVAKLGNLMAQKEAEEIRLGLKVDPEIKNKEEAEKKAKEQAKTLYENFQNTMNEVAGRYSISTFDKLIGNNPFNTNSLEGLRRMFDATEGSLQKLKEQKKEFEDAGKKGSDAYQEIIDKIKELEEELAKLGILVIVTNEQEEALKRRKKQIEAVGDAVAALGSIMGSLGQMTDDKALNAGAIIAQAIANYILGWSEATAKAAAAGPLGWVAFGLSTLAQVVAVVAQIHSLSGYASGGIISGGSNYGDQILARVNAGEMILNRKQQSNLFRAIESGNIGAGQTVLVPEFKIKGSDLYGTLRNFSKSVGKTGKVTGIR